MPVGTAKMNRVRPAHREGVVYPSTFFSEWVIACTDPSVVDASPDDPGGITREAQRLVELTGKGTLLEICLAYLATDTVPTHPIIHPMGRSDSGIWQKLLDRHGIHAQTLTVTPASDAKGQSIAGSTDESGNADTEFASWGNYRFSKTVTVDTNGNVAIMLPVETAYNATGTPASARLLCRIK